MAANTENKTPEILPETLKFDPQKLKNAEWIPLFEYNGILWPTFPPFRAKGAEQAITDVMNLPAKDGDIIICTYAKSGTHWIHEIAKMLLENRSDIDKEPKQNSMLEFLPDLSTLEAMPSPRLLSTHFQFQYIPKEHIEKRNKIIHMIRNPKDVLVSYFHHAQRDAFLNMNVPFTEFFDTCMSGKAPYGSWYDYELGMEKAQEKYPDMIYTCYYEAMKKDPENEIKRLATFLEADCSEKTIKGIAKATSFDSMQKHKIDTTSFLDKKGKGFIYRKGEIGDWKNHFTVAQNEQFDKQFSEKMKDSTYKITFE